MWIAAVVGLLVAMNASCVLDREPAPTVAPPIPSHGSGEGTELADAILRLLREADSPASLSGMPELPPGARGVVYVALRAGGLRVATAWAEAASPTDALAAALVDARDQLGAEERLTIDAVEVSIAGSILEDDGGDPVADNIDRGMLGMSVTVDDGRTLYYAPTQMIADNTSFERVLERLYEDGELARESVPPDRVTLFDATQLLIDLEPAAVIPLERGNVLVPAESVSRATTEALSDGMSTWLVGQLDEDGRMVYEYWPSRGEESTSNNMIRQWMATRALTRIAIERGDEALVERAETNIEYNLGISYREEGGLGLIADPDGDVKLGAVALAALAISEHPARGRFADEEAALRRTVDELWRTDGSFETFIVPAGRNDNQNFYPGEALLLWASTLEVTNDPELLERFMRSFEYYRDWHREQRNPAFVPWHTMAYEKVWRVTNDPDLRDFVFEMNDWLLDMQQWEAAPTPDVAGRFYNPEHPEYGPPHASSDGVYLEGLIAAHRLAVADGDENRAEAYRVAIARGLRNLMQLQFADEVDMFYVSRRERVAGGLRTTVYDNRIRVDNVQHGLLAVLDVLEAWEADDYAISRPSSVLPGPLATSDR